MAIYMTEVEVRELLPMERAIELVESSFLEQHRGRAVNRSRERILLPGSSLHYMAAALPEEDWLGMKIYAVTPRGMRFVVLLFSAENGDLLAMMDADHLGRLRTGAASGVATKFMARPDAVEVGLIGAGRQARTQLQAVACVRRLKRAAVYCRDERRRKEFCAEMEASLGIPIEPAASAESAVRPADIVITATNSREAVVLGDWLKPGAHINAIGANMPNRREVDGAVLSRAASILVDSIDQALHEAGDLIQGLKELGRDWSGIGELHEAVSGSLAARRSEQDVTLFKSCGIAIWDVAVAGFVYGEAVKKGKGSRIEPV